MISRVFRGMSANQQQLPLIRHLNGWRSDGRGTQYLTPFDASVPANRKYGPREDGALQSHVQDRNEQCTARSLQGSATGDLSGSSILSGAIFPPYFRAGKLGLLISRHCKD